MTLWSRDRWLHRVGRFLPVAAAVVVAPLVRMGASIVAATLRTMGSPLTIDVVDSRQKVVGKHVANGGQARRPAAIVEHQPVPAPVVERAGAG